MLHWDKATPVNIDVAIKRIDKIIGKPRFRAAHGQWTPYAWIVRGLVERGHLVVESVRSVVYSSGLTPVDVAERSIRSAYYKIREREWPANFAELAATHGITKQNDNTRIDDDEV